MLNKTVCKISRLLIAYEKELLSLHYKTITTTDYMSNMFYISLSIYSFSDGDCGNNRLIRSTQTSLPGATEFSPSCETLTSQL